MDRDSEVRDAGRHHRRGHTLADLVSRTGIGRVLFWSMPDTLVSFLACRGRFAEYPMPNDRVHNVIVCTQCSCTAYTIIGLPPDWYKDFEYRARVVRESRTVLREMGLDLPLEIEIRVWDTSADARYMVLPVQPPETVGWPEDRLVELVTKDSMIGVARLERRAGGTQSMDGMHDLGGRQGFSRVRHSPKAKVFHAPWEKRVNALLALAVKHGLVNMVEYRHAIERMEPRNYLAAGYYERPLTGLATLCVEKGFVTREELEQEARVR